MRNLKQKELHRLKNRGKKADDKTRKGTEDHKNQRLAILKRLYPGDENELERKLRLETATRRLRRRMRQEKQVWRIW